MSILIQIKGGDQDKRKSTYDYLFITGEAQMSQRSKKQEIITISYS